MVTAQQILSLFPYPHGVYRLVRRTRLYRAVKVGWRFVGRHEGGKLRMWLNSPRGKTE